MDSSVFEFLQDNIAQTPFHKWLMPELIDVNERENSVAIRLKSRPELGHTAGRTDMHGGVVAALVDIAGHAAIAAKMRHSVPTIDMRVDYLRPASGAEIIASASIIKMGRSIGVVDIRVTNDEKKLVAAGRASYVTS